jgi:hypothetical protein
MNNILITINIIGYENAYPIVLNPSHVPIVYVSVAEDPWKELQNNEEFFKYIQDADIVNFETSPQFNYLETIKNYLNTDICIATYTTDEFGQDIYDTRECSFQDFCNLYDYRAENIKKSIVRYCFDYLFDKAYNKSTPNDNVTTWWETLSETFGDKLTKETLINSIRAKMQSPKYDEKYPLFGNHTMSMTTVEAVLDYIKEQLNITE